VDSVFSESTVKKFANCEVKRCFLQVKKDLRADNIENLIYFSSVIFKCLECKYPTLGCFSAYCLAINIHGPLNRIGNDRINTELNCLRHCYDLHVLHKNSRSVNIYQYTCVVLVTPTYDVSRSRCTSTLQNIAMETQSSRHRHRHRHRRSQLSSTILSVAVKLLRRCLICTSAFRCTSSPALNPPTDRADDLLPSSATHVPLSEQPGHPPARPGGQSSS
jgi:hypothetical protein